LSNAAGITHSVVYYKDEKLKLVTDKQSAQSRIKENELCRLNQTLWLYQNWHRLPQSVFCITNC